MLIEACALLLAEGGLRPSAALWMPDGIPVCRGFCKPGLGCLDPNKKIDKTKISYNIFKTTFIFTLPHNSLTYAQISLHIISIHIYQE